MRRLQSVGVQVYVAALAASLVLWGLATIVSVESGKQWHQEGNRGIETDQQLVGILLAEANEAPLTSERLATVLAEAHPQQRFALFDSTGRSLVERGGQELPTVDATRVEFGESSVRSEDGAEFSRYVAASGRTYFAVTRYTLTSGQWWVTGTSYALGLASVLLIWSIVAWGFGRRIGRPLRQMAGTAAEFASGNLAARTRLDRSDEIGTLGRSFDEMADRIEALVAGQRLWMAQIAHELRTPLARLGVAVDLAEQGEAQRAQSRILGMRGDLDELTALVSDILALSRLDVSEARGDIDAGLRREVVRPETLAALVVRREQLVEPSREVSVETVMPLPELCVDRVLLARVLHNLIANARKYAPPDTAIRVRIFATDSVHFSVEDCGPGLPESELERVFEPFFRGAESDSATTEGHGLGLSLCRRVARLHGGDVRLRNREEGGLAAELSLPAADAVPTGGAPAGRQGPRA